MIERVLAREYAAGEMGPRRWKQCAGLVAVALFAGCAAMGGPQQGLTGGSEGSRGRRKGERAVAGPDQEELRGGVRVFQRILQGGNDPRRVSGEDRADTVPFR